MTVTTKVIALILTTKCTLRCKKCVLGIPYFKDQKHDSFENITAELNSIFRIYDHVERIDVSGGEALLHPDIARILEYATHFERQFDSLRVISNGTVLPNVELLELLQRHGDKYGFLVDDYGSLSPQKATTLDLLDKYKIPYKVNVYHGDNQYCGGWIDFGGFENRDYTNEELNRVFKNCHTSENPCITLFEGAAYFCVRSMCGYKFGHYELSPDERIDLTNNGEPLDINRKKAAEFGKHPPVGCMYCNGFDTENSERFPAAEQL